MKHVIIAIHNELIIAYDEALYEYKRDHAAGSSPATVGFEAGRVDGLKSALAVLKKHCNSISLDEILTEAIIGNVDNPQ